MVARGKQQARGLPLWPEEWANLERLAAEFGTVPPSGPNAGHPSWRSLVKEIARGNISLVRASEVQAVHKLYDSMVCPFCGETTTVVAGGIPHLRAHVRAGEAEEVLVAGERRFRKPGEVYPNEDEVEIVMRAGEYIPAPTTVCPFCSREITATGGGVLHLRAHVRKGEAEEIEIDGERAFRLPGLTFDPERERLVIVVRRAGESEGPAEEN